MPHYKIFIYSHTSRGSAASIYKRWVIKVVVTPSDYPLSLLHDYILSYIYLSKLHSFSIPW